MVWIDPEKEGRTRGYITDPAQERVATRAILQGVPLEKILEQFGALPQGLMVITRASEPDALDDEESPPPTR